MLINEYLLNLFSLTESLEALNQNQNQDCIQQMFLVSIEFYGHPVEQKTDNIRFHQIHLFHIGNSVDLLP